MGVSALRVLAPAHDCHHGMEEINRELLLLFFILSNYFMVTGSNCYWLLAACDLILQIPGPGHNVTVWVADVVSN